MHHRSNSVSVHHRLHAALEAHMGKALSDFRYPQHLAPGAAIGDWAQGSLVNSVWIFRC